MPLTGVGVQVPLRTQIRRLEPHYPGDDGTPIVISTARRVGPGPNETEMVDVDVATSDGRVLAYNRVLALVIVPFLLAGFAVLYLFPSDTQRLWAWTIKPTMTSMVLGSAYLGGAYFFVRVLRQPSWNAIRTGFVSVALFAGLLGIATIVHWDKFNHGHVAFWLWAGLYLTTPLLVAGGALANQRVARAARPDEPRIGSVARWTIGAIGALALAQGVVMFVAPGRVIPLWPWLLTPLTCRVVGAIFCLGSAGLGVLVDPRWSSLRLMLQVEVIMVTLMLAAAVRARGQFDTGRPLTWVLLVGFVGVLVGSAWLWRTQARHS